MRDNGTVELAAKPRSAAQTLTPGTYEGRITFKKTGGGEPVVQTVRLLVSLHFR